MTAQHWELKDPQVGQECVVWGWSGVTTEAKPKFYRTTRILMITPAGRIRTDSGSIHSLFDLGGRCVVKWGKCYLSNDPQAVALAKQEQAKTIAHRQQQEADQKAREADPRWPIAAQLNYNQSTRETFDKLAVLTSDELAQLATLLNKVEKGSV